MNTIDQLKEELQYEYNVTKAFVEKFPSGKNDYAPHEKSTKLKPLAEHIVDLFSWPELIANTDKLDFGEDDYKPIQAQSKEDLLQELEKGYQKSVDNLNKLTEEDLAKTWKLEHNGHTLASWNKYGAMRHSLNQITHHRAQMGMYYRQLEIPLPGSYGPSGDDNSF